MSQLDITTLIDGDFSAAPAIRALAAAVVQLAKQVKTLQDQVDALQARDLAPTPKPKQKES
jgi:hypothetical protein